MPNWIEARDPKLRARSSNANLDKMKIWRSYDYPHMVMLYFHMYEIARTYPSMVKYLDAKGYLERAYQTARAYFTYPYEILPWYETYKWGCYNELVILDLIAALEREGFRDRAAWLRGEWEKKVKYFVYDDKYPVPLGVRHRPHRVRIELRAGQVRRDARHDARQEPVVRQEQEPLVLAPVGVTGRLADVHGPSAARRAWPSAAGSRPAYYLLGSDFTGSSDTGALSYMAEMGGWGILDYGLELRARALGLAAARLRVVPEFVGADEHRARRDELRLLVSRARERRRVGLAVHDGQVRARLDSQGHAARPVALRRRDRPRVRRGPAHGGHHRGRRSDCSA